MADSSSAELPTDSAIDPVKQALAEKVSIYQGIVTVFFLIPFIIFAYTLQKGKKTWSDPRKKLLIYISCIAGMSCSILSGLYAFSFITWELRWFSKDHHLFSALSNLIYAIVLGIFYISSYLLRSGRLHLAKSHSPKWTRILIWCNMIEIIYQTFVIIVQILYVFQAISAPFDYAILFPVYQASIIVEVLIVFFVELSCNFLLRKVFRKKHLSFRGLGWILWASAITGAMTFIVFIYELYYGTYNYMSADYSDIVTAADYSWALATVNGIFAEFGAIAFHGLLTLSLITSIDEAKEKVKESLSYDKSSIRVDNVKTKMHTINIPNDELNIKVAKHQAIVTVGFIIPVFVFGMALKRGIKAWSDPRKKKLVYFSCFSGILCSLAVGLYSLSFVSTELEWIDRYNTYFYSIAWSLYVLFLALFYIASYQLRISRLLLAKHSSRWTHLMTMANRIEIIVLTFVISSQVAYIVYLTINLSTEELVQPIYQYSLILEVMVVFFVELGTCLLLRKVFRKKRLSFKGFGIVLWIATLAGIMTFAVSIIELHLTVYRYMSSDYRDVVTAADYSWALATFIGIISEYGAISFHALLLLSIMTSVDQAKEHVDKLINYDAASVRNSIRIGRATTIGGPSINLSPQ